MRHPWIAASVLVLFSLAPALALRAQPDQDDSLLPYLKQGYRESQALAREDAKLGLVHAMVLEEGEGVARHRSVLFVFATRDGQRKLIHQAEYAWASLDRLADIDRDGRLDLVVRAGNGGNCWTCGWVEALSLAPDRVTVLVPPEKYQQLEDVDGDGRLEAIASDSSWEFYEGMCHACSPRVERIFSLTRGAWVDTSSAYPQFYREALRTLETQLVRQAAENTVDWDEYQLGTLISILLNRVQLGEKQAAWQAFDEQIAAWRALPTADDENRQRLDALVAALKKALP